MSDHPSNETAIDEQRLLDAVAARWRVDPKLALDALRTKTEAVRQASILTAGGFLVGSVVAIVMGVRSGAGMTSPITIGALVISIFAILIGIQGHRRRVPLDRIAGRLFEGRFESTCPFCGGDPFTKERCCHRFPEGWSSLDLYGFWHEFAAPYAPRGRPGAAKILRGLFATDRTTAQINSETEAWWRCRGPMATSASHPKSDFGLQRGIRLLFRHRASAKLLATLAALIFFVWMLLNGTFNQSGATIIVILVLTWMLFSYVRSWRRKAPIGDFTRPRCRRCRHLLHPPFPDRCTECGEDLTASDSITFNPDEPVIQTSTTRSKET